MSAMARELKQTAQSLREAFDAAFADTEPSPPPVPLRLVQVRIAERPFAFRLDELAELSRPVPLEPLVASVPALLGLVSLHRGLIPVFDTSELLGLGSLACSSAGHWLVVCRSREVIALAVESVQGLLETGDQDLSMLRESDGAGRHVKAVARVKRELVNILDLASLVREIERNLGSRRKG